MNLQIPYYPSAEHSNTHEQDKTMAQQGMLKEGRRSAISEAISLIEEMR